MSNKGLIDFKTADYEDFDSKVEDIAASKGCTVFYPDENQLTIDIDTEDQYKKFLIRFDEFAKFSNLAMGFSEIASKSGLPHRHIVINCSKKFSESERICLQFCLCSDPIRETMNMWRHLLGVERPTRFFQPINN